MTTRGNLKTVGMIAEELGVKVHQVTYQVKRLGIEPSQRAGHRGTGPGAVRLFGPREVAKIRKAIAR